MLSSLLPAESLALGFRSSLMVPEDSGGMPGGRDGFSAPAEGPGALPEPMVGVSRDSPRVLE